jgi:hypothetical protein
VKAKKFQPEGVAERYSGGDAFNYFIPTNDDTGIDLIPLDDFIRSEKIEKVDLIKIDIEGAELLCFKGAKVLLSNAEKPIILFECAEELTQNFGHTKFEVLSYLASLGYKIREIENNQYLAYINA